MDAKGKLAILALTLAVPLVHAADYDNTTSLFDYGKAVIGMAAGTASGWIISAVYSSLIFIGVVTALFFVFGLHNFALSVMRSILMELSMELPMHLGIIRLAVAGKMFVRTMGRSTIWRRMANVTRKYMYHERVRTITTKLGGRIDRIVRPWDIKTRIRRDIESRAAAVLATAGQTAKQTTSQTAKQTTGQRRYKPDINIKRHVKEVARHKYVQLAWYGIKYIWSIVKEPTLMQAIIKAAKIDERIERRISAETNPTKRGMLYLTAIWVGIWPRVGLYRPPPGVTDETKLFYLHQQGGMRTSSKLKDAEKAGRVLADHVIDINNRFRGYKKPIIELLNKYREGLRSGQLTEEDKARMADAFGFHMKRAVGFLRSVGRNIDERIERNFNAQFEVVLKEAQEGLRRGDPSLALELFRHVDVNIRFRKEQFDEFLVNNKRYEEVKTGWLYTHVVKVLKNESNPEAAREMIKRMEKAFVEAGARPLPDDFKKALMKDYEVAKTFAPILEREAQSYFERAKKIKEPPFDTSKAFAHPEPLESAIYKYTPATVAIAYGLSDESFLRYLNRNMKYGDRESARYAIYAAASSEGAKAGWLGFRLPSDRFHGSMLKGGVSRVELEKIINPKVREVVNAYSDELSALTRLNELLPELRAKQKIAEELGEWLKAGGAARLKEHLSSGKADKEMLDKLEKLRMLGIEVKSEKDVDRAIEIVEKWRALNLDPKNIEAARLQLLAEKAEATGNRKEAETYWARLAELRAEAGDERLGVKTTLEMLAELGQLDPDLRELFLRASADDAARKGGNDELRKLAPATAEMKTTLEITYVGEAYVFERSAEKIPAVTQFWESVKGHLEWVEDNYDRVFEYLLGYNRDKDIADKLKELKELGVVIKDHEDLRHAIAVLNALREVDLDPRIFKAAEYRMYIQRAHAFGDHEGAAAYESRLAELREGYLNDLRSKLKSIEEEINRLKETKDEYAARLTEIQAKIKRNEGNREELEYEMKTIKEEMKIIDGEIKKLNYEKTRIEIAMNKVDRILNEETALRILGKLRVLDPEFNRYYMAAENWEYIRDEIFEHAKEPTIAEILKIAETDPERAERLLREYHEYLGNYVEQYKDAEYPWTETAKNFGGGLAVEPVETPITQEVVESIHKTPELSKKEIDRRFDVIKQLSRLTGDQINELEALKQTSYDKYKQWVLRTYEGLTQVAKENIEQDLHTVVKLVAAAHGEKVPGIWEKTGIDENGKRWLYEEGIRLLAAFELAGGNLHSVLNTNGVVERAVALADQALRDEKLREKLDLLKILSNAPNDVRRFFNL